MDNIAPRSAAEANKLQKHMLGMSGDWYLLQEEAEQKNLRCSYYCGLAMLDESSQSIPSPACPTLPVVIVYYYYYVASLSILYGCCDTYPLSLDIPTVATLYIA